jgi:hypothetical protein
MMFGGITSLQAALSHAPVDKEEKERYIFVAMPHIAISKDGAIGKCKRKGREELSSACGALLKFKGQFDDCKSGKTEMSMELDLDDMELTLLKQRLVPKLKDLSHVPNLVEITKVCHDVIKEDFERMLEKTIQNNEDDHDYALLTAIQIHGPNDETWIWPYQDSDFVVLDHVKKNLRFTDEKKIEVYETPK